MRVRCRVTRHCVVDSGLVHVVLALAARWYCPLQSRASDSAMAVGRGVIETRDRKYIDLDLCDVRVNEERRSGTVVGLNCY